MKEIKHPSFSVVIPVFNRPEELRHLLESLSRQLLIPAEIIIVEDGSDVPSEHVCSEFSSKLPITYLKEKNTGPAVARNKGAAVAKESWIFFFDSDCELPEHYFTVISEVLEQDNELALMGGPDSAAPDFNRYQKAVSYAMTSILTTGGIRGGKEKADLFYPRTFNMGIRRDVFEAVHGFRDLRFGEDLDFSMRVIKAGFKSALIPDAFVYHRRRTSTRAFFRQVFNSGMARIVLEEFHPGTLRVVHTLPSFFSIFLLFSIVFSTVNPLALIPALIPGVVWFFHASFTTKSILTGALASWCSYVQLTGYGTGFFWARTLKVTGTKKLSDRYAFRKTFYD